MALSNAAKKTEALFFGLFAFDGGCTQEGKNKPMSMSGLFTSTQNQTRLVFKLTKLTSIKTVIEPLNIKKMCRKI